MLTLSAVGRFPPYDHAVVLVGSDYHLNTYHLKLNETEKLLPVFLKKGNRKTQKRQTS
jgi:hypothetical protein